MRYLIITTATANQVRHQIFVLSGDYIKVRFIYATSYGSCQLNEMEVITYISSHFFSCANSFKLQHFLLKIQTTAK